VTQLLAARPSVFFSTAPEMFMTTSDIRQVILDIIADIDDEADFSALDADKPLRDQLDLDSMDFLDIVMELRKRYKLQIPEADYPKLATLNSCVEYLQPLLQNV
jgi:acyl carrier protein